MRLPFLRAELMRHPEWRQSWRWASMRFSAANVVMNTVGAIALKGAAASASVLGLIPMRYALLIGAAVSLAAMVGRLTLKKPKATT